MNAHALLDFYVEKAKHRLVIQEGARLTTYYLVEIPDERGPIARLLGGRRRSWRACRVWDEDGETWIHEIWVNGTNVFQAKDQKAAEEVIREAAKCPRDHGRWAPALMMDCPNGRTAWVYSAPMLLEETFATGH